LNPTDGGTALHGNAAPLGFADLPHYAWLQLPVWVFDAERLCVAWANDAALHYWRAASLPELLARDMSGVSPAVRTRLAVAMATHARGQTTREVWTLYPQGAPVSSVLAGRAITLPDGRAAILFASEPLAASYDAAALRGVDAMLHTNVRVALHRLADGAVLMRNPAATSTFGPADADGVDPWGAMFVDPAIAAQALQQVRAGEVFRCQTQLATLAGPRWHALAARPAHDPVTGDAAVQFNAGDITELKASQAALEAARDAAEAASRAKSAFLANISHEIRTPMNGVLGLTELVLNTELNPRQREFLQLAQSSARSLMAIIDDLLDLSKIEAQKLTLAPAPFALRALLHQTLAAPALEAEGKGLVLACTVAPAVFDHRVGDAQRLRQVLLNLVGNAVKFTAHGRVDVNVQADGDDTLVFCVTDTGIGMSDAQLLRVFEPFTQADTSITRRYGGTGLGLSIAQRLVVLMGGLLTAQSEPDRGSRFEFTLPLPAASSD
jgi:signal transduction histidine kinase